MSRRLAADISWLWAGYAARSLAYLAVIVLLTRSLGPHDFGELSLFIAFGVGVTSLAGSWPFWAVPILANRGRRIAEVFLPAVRLAAISTGVSLIIALPVAWKLLEPSISLLLLLSIYSITLVSLQGLYGVFQAEGRMRDIAIAQAAERLITLGLLLIVLLGTSITVRMAEGTLALSAVAISVFAYLAAVDRQDLLGGEGELDWHTVRRAIGAMGIVNAASYGVAWVDIYLLALFKPGADVGLYGLAYQIYTVAVQLAILWMVATLPRHARAFHAGVAPADQLPQEHVLMGVRLWASLVGLGAIVAAVSLTSVFGSNFGDSTQPLMVLLVGASFLAPYLAVVSVLVAADQGSLVAKVSVVCVTINIVVDLILIPPVGLMGPAVATTVQVAVAAVWILYRCLGRQRLTEIIKVNAPVAFAIAVLAVDPTSALFLGATVLVSFITAIPAIRWLRINGSQLFAGRAESPILR